MLWLHETAAILNIEHKSQYFLIFMYIKYIQQCGTNYSLYKLYTVRTLYTVHYAYNEQEHEQKPLPALYFIPD